MEKIYITKGEAETEQIGEAVASLVPNNGFVALYGNLGAGKTVFTRGFVGKLIPKAKKLVHSPTFALVNEYIGTDCKIYHFDMYRVSGDDELYAMGFDDYFGNGIIITEWSENIPGSLPEDAIKVVIERLSDNERKITVRTSFGGDEK